MTSETEDTLWDMEKRFWTEGRDFYEGNLGSEALMVFPYPTGILDRDQAMKAVEGVPDWASVEMEEQSLRERGSTAVLAYRATAYRKGAETAYSALCASTYVNDDGTWVMLSHQQVPTSAGPSGDEEE